MTRNISFSKHPDTAQEHERLREESIKEWQAKGPAAIIAASWELTILSYLLKGQDVANVPMNKSVFEKRIVPWLKENSADE